MPKEEKAETQANSSQPNQAGGLLDNTLEKILNRQRYQNQRQKKSPNAKTAGKLVQGAGKVINTSGKTLSKKTKTEKGLSKYGKQVGNYGNLMQRQSFARNNLLRQKDQGAGEEALKKTTKETSRQILNGLWFAVLEDWTTLTFWGLHVYLIASFIFKDKMAQFGEDDVIGTWLGGGRISRMSGTSSRFAQLIEILILAIVDTIIIGIILLIIYILYKISTTGYFAGIRILWNMSTGDPEEAMKILLKEK